MLPQVLPTRSESANFLTLWILALEIPKAIFYKSILYQSFWKPTFDCHIPVSCQNLFTNINMHISKSFSFSGKREANQSMEFLLALKSEHIRSALLDEFSSREACSSSAFCSSKAGTYWSQEELFLRISGHGDVFITLKNVRIWQIKVFIYFPSQ